MATKKEYPVTLNPFDSEPDEDDDKNPFKDSDDDDNVPAVPPPVKDAVAAKSFVRPRSPPPPRPESNLVPSTSSSSLRFSSRNALTPEADHSPSAHRGSFSSISRNSDAESLPSPSAPRKTKRPAPAAPMKSPVKSPAVHSVEILPNNPVVDNGSLRKKKPAPLPPQRPSVVPNVAVVVPDTVLEKPASEVPDALENQLDCLSIGTGARQLTSRDVRTDAVNNTDASTVSDDDLSLEIDASVQATSPEMQRFLEQWRALKAEQKEIESELRTLMECGEESRTVDIVSREQFLMDALVENVKKRQDLEEEVEEEEDRHEHSASNESVTLPSKKMKKKKRFKLKKLLGVHS